MNQISLQDEAEAGDLREIQDKDHDVSLVKAWVVSGERPEFKNMSSHSNFVKSLWSQWSRLHIRDDLLVRSYEILGTDIVWWQTVVPLTYRRNILKYTHDIKASGHLGVTKTLSKIQQRYYWPGVQNDVRTYIAGCEKCARRKDPNRIKQAPMQIVRSGYPFERIAIDILGEFPITERGHKYILVIGDYFTKWTECFPMPNMEAVTVAKILVNEVIARF
ncbi:MAG: hypothetical protein JAZ03_22135 [Candidatus Thiodiazotropha taylori]|nr:hypothetical protein [Candidatus Thiodiazotropha taylori]MCW4336628.1 hypothetical protein [Candidatus Thiodiazotropha endolucinida]